MDDDVVSDSATTPVPEDTPPVRPFEPFAELSSRPGTHAPHLVVERRGQQLSTHDLFGRGFALLCGDPAWLQAADRLREDCCIPLNCHIFGPFGDLDDPEGRWPRAYGVGDDSAVLISLDGFVVWRALGAEIDIEGRLVQVLYEIGVRADHRDGARR